MQQNEPSQSCKLDRGAVEKHRRKEMKNLCSRLALLLPPPISKEKLALPALLDKTYEYVKQTKERIDELKERKEQLQALVLPALLINVSGSSLELNLFTGLNKSFILRQVLAILEEEGVQVLNASCSTLKDRILYTIHSQAFSARIGIETSRVHERLKKLSGAN